QDIFDYLSQNPEDMEICASAMSSFTSAIANAVVDAYDFADINMLVDVGGSRGMVLAVVLDRNPRLNGILFDLPQVVAGASNLLKKNRVDDRVEVRGGNFFESVPEGADAYLLKHVLHDWGEHECLEILKNIHLA